MDGYCPKCGSRLYPDDEKYIRAVGRCGYCVTYNRDLMARYESAVKADLADKIARSKEDRAKERPWWNKD